MDPDYFVLDTFRVPGLNTLMQLPSPPTMIACMTTFCIEAIRKMPEYWWLNYAPAHALFRQARRGKRGRGREWGESSHTCETDLCASAALWAPSSPESEAACPLPLPA